MISQLERPTQEQTAHLDFAESIRQIVLEETDGGRRIVQCVASIMEGDAPNCTPWHRLEAAKLLNKLGLGITPTNRPSPRTAEETITQSLSTGDPTPPLPAGEGWGEGSHNIPSPVNGEGQDGGEEAERESCPSCSSMSDERIKLNKKLVRQIRVDTYDGASMVRNLVDIMEGEDPGTRGRDRIEAIKILLNLCLDSPAFPDAEFMMQYAPCHPDCLCVCKDLPEDHPKVVEAHTPLTAEQREQWAEQQAQQEEWDRRTEELIERKKRADKQWKLEMFNDPGAVADRRIEREEQRKRLHQKREQEQEQEKDRRQELRERISRESRFGTWQYNQQQQHQQDHERARSP